MTPPSPQDLDALTADQREAYDERAGIMEFVGELPRAEAEARAYREVVDLTPPERVRT